MRPRLEILFFRITRWACQRFIKHIRPFEDHDYRDDNEFNMMTVVGGGFRPTHL